MTTDEAAAQVLAEIWWRNMARKINPLEWPQVRCTLCGSDPFETALMDTDQYGVICIDHKRCSAAQQISQGRTPGPVDPSVWED